jgi:CBS domain containing-hemolysin-like protein
VAAHEDLTVEERELIDDVFAAGDRELREVMVPRTETDFLSAALPVFKAARLVSEMPHSRYPVIRDSSDDVVGFVHIRDLLDPDMSDRGIRVGELAREIVSFPGTKNVKTSSKSSSVISRTSTTLNRVLITIQSSSAKSPSMACSTSRIFMMRPGLNYLMDLMRLSPDS